MYDTTRLGMLVALIAAPMLAACGDSATGPDPAQGLTPVPPSLDAELAISVDEDLAGTALATAEAELGTVPSPAAEERLDEARDQFSEARRLWAAGDDTGARDRGRRARWALSQALVEGRGPVPLADLFEEIEALITTLGASDEGYAGAATLGTRLASLVHDARQAEAAGRELEAAERIVAARLHADRAARDWHRDSDRRNDVLGARGWVRLQVAQGASAIRLAWGLVGDAPTEAQARLLQAAEALQSRAQTALATGHPGAAASLAHHAEIKALIAVVVTADGLTHEGVHAVAALAAQLLEEARAVVASGGSAVDLAILKIAVRLYEQGTARLEAGNPRGVVLLWHSATMSAVLIGG